MGTVWVQRITFGHTQAVVTVWMDGKPPEPFIFSGVNGGYDALLFERMIDAQIRLITHGRVGLEVVKE